MPFDLLLKRCDDAHQWRRDTYYGFGNVIEVDGLAHSPVVGVNRPAVDTALRPR